ncbi:MAG: ribbon-helix-helix domain-containing protein [Candidatus Thorarchaeota archaeon]|jgi:metal-responsive CopG/Arc/MetJ family transcriptional regulator
MTGKKEKEKKDLTEKMLSKLDAPEIDPARKKVAVMARLQPDLVEYLDALVRLKIYSSRSDAVAGIIRKEVLAEPDVYEQVRLQAQKMDEMESATEELAQKVRQ